MNAKSQQNTRNFFHIQELGIWVTLKEYYLICIQLLYEMFFYWNKIDFYLINAINSKTFHTRIYSVDLQ